MATEELGAPVAVAFVSSHARNGGAERYLETLLSRLGGDWVRAVVCLEDGPLLDRLRRRWPTAVLPTGAGWRDILRSAWRLRRQLRRARPQVVHANGFKAALVSILATLGTHVPVVWFRHDFSFDGRPARLVARRCRMTICVSQALARGLPRARTIYTPLLSEDEPRPVRPLHLPGDRRHVALVGYFHPFKGQADLVEVAPLVLEHVPEAHFLLVGGEDPNATGYLESVRARTRELGLEEAITFLGHRPDAVEILRASELALVLTGGRGEGFGLAALEALSVRTPVIGYETGALPELVGECGRLVPDRDRSALADAIIELLRDDALRQELAACGEARVRKEFSPDRWAAGIVDAYREAA